jgi:hypothetical protein
MRITFNAVNSIMGKAILSVKPLCTFSQGRADWFKNVRQSSLQVGSVANDDASGAVLEFDTSG